SIDEININWKTNEETVASKISNMCRLLHFIYFDSYELIRNKRITPRRKNAIRALIGIECILVLMIVAAGLSVDYIYAYVGIGLFVVILAIIISGTILLNEKSLTKRLYMHSELFKELA